MTAQVVHSSGQACGGPMTSTASWLGGMPTGSRATPRAVDPATGTVPPRQWYHPHDVPGDVKDRIHGQWIRAFEKLDTVMDQVPIYVAQLQSGLHLMSTVRDLAEVPVPTKEMFTKNMALIQRTVHCPMSTSLTDAHCHVNHMRMDGHCHSQYKPHLLTLTHCANVRMIKDISACDGSLRLQYELARDVCKNLVDFGYMCEDSEISLTTPPGGIGRDHGHYTMRPEEVPTQPDAINGPQWCATGHKHGYKVWAGDLPRTLQKAQLARVIGTGWLDIALNNDKSASGQTYAVITYDNLDMAITCFRTLVASKFDNGQGVVEPPVRWWRGRDHKSTTPW